MRSKGRLGYLVQPMGVWFLLIFAQSSSAQFLQAHRQDAWLSGNSPQIYTFVCSGIQIQTTISEVRRVTQGSGIKDLVLVSRPLPKNGFVSGKCNCELLEIYLPTLRSPQDFAKLEEILNKLNDTKNQPTFYPNVIRYLMQPIQYGLGPDSLELQTTGAWVLSTYRGPQVENVLIAVLDSASSLPSVGQFDPAAIAPVTPNLTDIVKNGYLQAIRGFLSSVPAISEYSRYAGYARDFDFRRAGFDLSDAFNSSIRGHGPGHGIPIAWLAHQAAPGSQILPVRVCNNQGRCRETDIIVGICFAQSYAQSRGFENAPDKSLRLVLNLSFGSPTHSIPLEQIVSEAINNGVLVAAAAGNYNPELPAHLTREITAVPGEKMYPAALAEANYGVLSVTSLEPGAGANDSPRPSRTSNFFPTGSSGSSWIKIAASGRSVLSYNQGSTSHLYSGTSFATPQVAGWLACIQSNFPDSAARRDFLTNSNSVGNPNRWPQMNDSRGSFGGALNPANTICAPPR